MKKNWKLLLLGLTLFSLASCGEGTGISSKTGGVIYSYNYNNYSSARSSSYVRSSSSSSSSSSSAAYVSPAQEKSLVKNYVISKGTYSSKSGNYYIDCGYSTWFYYIPKDDQFEVFSYTTTSDGQGVESFLIEFSWGNFASATGIFLIDINSSRSFTAAIAGFTMGNDDWISISFRVTYCESSSLLQNGKDCLVSMASTATLAANTYLKNHSLPSMY